MTVHRQRSPLSEALRVCTEQLLRLQAEDIDAYLACVDEQERLCAAVAGLDASGLTDSQRAQVERLARTNAEVLSLVREWLQRSGSQMRKLRGAHELAGAYAGGGSPARSHSRTA